MTSATPALMQAAVACLSAHGLRKTSLNDVAVCAGVSRATVYRAFGSKDRMLRTVWMSELQGLLDGADQQVEPFEPVEEQLATLMSYVVDEARAHPLVARCLAEEPELVGPAIIEGPSREVSSMSLITAGLADVLRRAGTAAQLSLPAEQVAEVIARVSLTLLCSPTSHFSGTRAISGLISRGVVDAPARPADNAGPVRHNRGVDTDLVDLLKAIDPAVLGRRIKSARVAQGLTQSQLAGDNASIAYVSRIEAGQRRPDGRLLEQLATRLGASVEQFLLGVTKNELAELRLMLDYAELALASGNASEAVERAAEVLDRPIDGPPTDVHRHARFIKARGLEAAGQLDDAIIDLEALMAEDRRDVSWVRTAIALSRCYRESGDIARAIDTGELAVRQLETSDLAGSDEAVQIAVTLAAAYFERGDTGHAVRLCRKAIAAAERLDSPVAKASAYWNASVMESEQGALDAAISLAKKAIALLEGGEDARNLARLRSQLGILQLRLDPPEMEEAQSNLELAGRELAWSSASPTDVARNQLALARAHFYRGEFSEASAQASAIYDATRDVAPLLASDARVLEGQVAASEGDTELAKRDYRDAILTLTGVGADRGAAQLWFELGGLLEDVGESDDARDAYRRAAASTGLSTRRTSHARV